jgi:hypothetical protein
MVYLVPYRFVDVQLQVVADILDTLRQIKV